MSERRIKLSDDGEFLTGLNQESNPGKISGLITSLKERQAFIGSNALVSIGNSQYECLVFTKPFFNNTDTQVLNEDIDYFLITTSGFFLCRFGNQKLDRDLRQKLDIDRESSDIYADNYSAELKTFAKYLCESAKKRKRHKLSCKPVFSTIGLVPQIDVNNGFGGQLWAENCSIRYGGERSQIVSLNTEEAVEDVLKMLLEIGAAMDVKNKKILIENKIIDQLPSDFLEKAKNDDIEDSL